MRGRTPLARMHAVRLDGTSGTFISTPDHADLDLSPDFDLRIAMAPLGSTPNRIAKWNGSGKRSYMAEKDTVTVGTTNGGGTAVNVAVFTQRIFRNGNVTLERYTFDADNGAGGNVATEYLKPYSRGVMGDLRSDDAWDLLGAVTSAGTIASIFNGDTALELGSRNGGTAGLGACKIVGAVIKSSINGTTVAEFDASRMRVGDTTYTDRFGKVWTLNGNAHIAAA